MIALCGLVCDHHIRLFDFPLPLLLFSFSGWIPLYCNLFHDFLNFTTVLSSLLLVLSCDDNLLCFRLRLQLAFWFNWFNWNQDYDNLRQMSNTTVVITRLPNGEPFLLRVGYAAPESEGVIVSPLPPSLRLTLTRTPKDTGRNFYDIYGRNYGVIGLHCGTLIFCYRPNSV